MPIRIPDGLPAREHLLTEGVRVMTERVAIRQDIRPMRIGLLNLMPNKIRTELQIARLLGASPLQVEFTLVRVGCHTPKNTSADHLFSFYHTWDQVKDQKFDGFIITGAPVETLPFEDVTYWAEMKEIFDWTTTNVHSTLNICWGAMAAIWHFHGVPKYVLDRKLFGVYRHLNLHPASPYMAGFSDDFMIPVSRWTECRAEDVARVPGLEVLMNSDDTGLCIVHERKGNRLFVFNHIEYDSTSLAEEYFRDVDAGIEMQIPFNYFPDDDPGQPPLNRWRSHAHLLFGNWINNMYQTTPYDISRIGNEEHDPGY